jgi:hypothetical protein
VTLTDLLTDPVTLATLTLVIAGLVAWQRTLSWTEYRTLHETKKRLAIRIHSIVPVLLLSRKGYRDDDEYLETREQSVRAVFTEYVDAGGSPHLINSIKVRETPAGETQYSDAHVVWIHDDTTQTELYLFDNGDGTTDLYAHHETAVLDPDGHLTDPQTDGDPREILD